MIRGGWRALLAGLAVIVGAAPASAGVYVLTPLQGVKLKVPEFGSTISFQSQLLGGSGGHFGATFTGLIYADPRYCGGFPPGMEPQDCREPIDPVSGYGAFDATAGGESQWLFLPFSGSGVNGVLTFLPTDGGTVQIVIDADPFAVPEPATWLMLVGGMGAVGAAMRVRRRRVAIAASA